MTFEEELAALSSRCRDYIRTGKISMYSATLKEMANLFQRNDLVKEQLNVLAVSFYIDLSGFSRAPYIDPALAEQVQMAKDTGGIDVSELEQLYFGWIQPDMMPRHTMTVKDSWYLLRLCTEGKVEQAEYILSQI